MRDFLYEYARRPGAFEQYARRQATVTLVRRVAGATAAEDDVPVERFRIRTVPTVSSDEEDSSEDADTGADAEVDAEEHNVKVYKHLPQDRALRPAPNLICTQCNKRKANVGDIVCGSCTRMCQTCRDVPAYGRLSRCYACAFNAAAGPSVVGEIRVCPICSLPLGKDPRHVNRINGMACNTCYRRELRAANKRANAGEIVDKDE